MIKPTITPVFGGKFSCTTCGCAWIGTWHGPKEDITCIVCCDYIFPELRKTDNGSK